MMTIQLSIDEPVLTEIDLITRSLAITRADFIRQALEEALRKHQIKTWERQHREAYARHPQDPEEYEIPESDRVWEEP
jgi:metal-responsive CopG/Arc/MetJ family transcriptional regulator